MKIGYGRVSKLDQNPERNATALMAAGGEGHAAELLNLPYRCPF